MLIDQERAKGYLDKHGPLWLVKSSIVQMVRLVSSILAIILTLVQIIWEHNETNLAKVEILKKMLDDKKVNLVKRVKEVEWCDEKEADTKAQLKTTHELLA